MVRFALVLIFALSSGVFCLAAPVHFKSLAECQGKIDEYTAWYEANVAKHESLLADYKKLKAENASLTEENEKYEREIPLGGFGPYDKYKPLMNTGAAFVGFGIGGSIVFLIGKALWALKRLWPSSASSCQLVVLLATAVWISVAAWIGVNDSMLSRHPVNMLFTVLVYSIPALAFGGIGFWWFGKSKEKAQATTG
jgi:hypothetical protein